MVSVMIKHMEQHLVNGEFDLFFFIIPVLKYMIQHMRRRVFYPSFPKAALAHQPIHDVAGAAFEIVAGPNKTFMQFHPLPPDAFGIPHMEDGFLKTVKAAGYFRLLFFLRQGQDKIHESLVGPTIITGELLEQFLHVQVASVLVKNSSKFLIQLIYLPEKFSTILYNIFSREEAGCFSNSRINGGNGLIR